MQLQVVIYVAYPELPFNFEEVPGAGNTWQELYKEQYQMLSMSSPANSNRLESLKGPEFAGSADRLQHLHKGPVTHGRHCECRNNPMGCSG
jgi:hypothetical protein